MTVPIAAKKKPRMLEVYLHSVAMVPVDASMVTDGTVVIVVATSRQVKENATWCPILASIYMCLYEQRHCFLDA